MKITVVLALMLALGSCKFDLGSVLNLSQLGPQQTTQDVFLNATIAFESPTTDEKTAKVVEVIGKYFVAGGDPQEKGTGVSKSFVLPIKIPLLRDTDTPDDTSVFVIEQSEDDQGTVVSLRVNEDRFNQANDELQSVANVAAGLKEINFQFTLNNDRQAPCRLSLSSVYVDGQPVPFSEDLTVDLKQTVVLVPSNVLLDSLSGSNPMVLFRILKDEPEPESAP